MPRPQNHTLTSSPFQSRRAFEDDGALHEWRASPDDGTTGHGPKPSGGPPLYWSIHQPRAIRPWLPRYGSDHNLPKQCGFCGMVCLNEPLECVRVAKHSLCVPGALSSGLIARTRGAYIHTHKAVKLDKPACVSAVSAGDH